MARGRQAQARRATRPPMGIQYRMEIPAGITQEPSKVYRWVNDAENRVEAFLDRDWQVVTWDEGAAEKNSRAEPGSQVSRKLKSGIRAVLMMLDKELYEEDQRVKVEETMISEIDRPNRDGAVPEYVPGGGDNALRQDNSALR